MNIKDKLQQLTEGVPAQVTAQVEQPPRLPPVTTDSGFTAVTGGIGAAGLAVLYALLQFRRKISRDGVELTKDRVEGELLNKAMLERDAALARADALQAQRTIDAGMIAGLTERNKYLQEEILRVNKAFQVLEGKFEELRKTMDALNSVSRSLPTTPLNTGFTDPLL